MGWGVVCGDCVRGGEGKVRVNIAIAGNSERETEGREGTRR